LRVFGSFSPAGNACFCARLGTRVPLGARLRNHLVQHTPRDCCAPLIFTNRLGEGHRSKKTVVGMGTERLLVPISRISGLPLAIANQFVASATYSLTLPAKKQRWWFTVVPSPHWRKEHLPCPVSTGGNTKAGGSGQQSDRC
jgi:hypothetical protein